MCVCVCLSVKYIHVYIVQESGPNTLSCVSHPPHPTSTLCSNPAHPVLKLRPPVLKPRPPCAQTLPTLCSNSAHPVLKPCPPCAQTPPTLCSNPTHPVFKPRPPCAQTLPTCAQTLPTLCSNSAHPVLKPRPPCASCANLIDSIVCACTPSSAATTSTTMSVTCVPRARIDVKAACPGVSRKITR